MTAQGPVLEHQHGEPEHKQDGDDDGEAELEGDKGGAEAQRDEREDDGQRAAQHVREPVQGELLRVDLRHDGVRQPEAHPQPPRVARAHLVDQLLGARAEDVEGRGEGQDGGLVAREVEAAREEVLEHGGLVGRGGGVGKHEGLLGGDAGDGARGGGGGGVEGEAGEGGRGHAVQGRNGAHEGAGLGEEGFGEHRCGGGGDRWVEATRTKGDAKTPLGKSRMTAAKAEATGEKV